MSLDDLDQSGDAKPTPLTSVTTLTPKDHAQAAANLAEYIRSAKEDLTVLGSDLDWSAWKWPGVGSFIKYDWIKSSKRKNIPLSHLLDLSFIEFAKAYVRERHAQNPRESSSHHHHRLPPLRLLEMALLEFNSDANPANINIAVLDRAAALIPKYFTGQNVYQTGQALQAIASLLGKRQLTLAAVGSWVSPMPKVKQLGLAVGSAGEAHRASKLPDQDALKALAEIFNHDLNPLDPSHQRDIYTTSVTALLLSAPSRGGEETHHLPVDLVFKATDRFRTEQVGLRWEAGKGFGSYIKWIWDGMVPVAQIALDRVKSMTEEARNLARWMEDPKTGNRFYRHANCPNVDEDEPLTAEQVCMALGLSTVMPAASLKMAKLTTKNHTYSLHDLWHTHVIPRHQTNHPHFPYINAKEAAKGKKGGLKFSEALFCMRANQLHPGMGTSPVQLWMPSLPRYLQDVGLSDATRTSIFDRHGYRDSNGEPLKLRSHSMRHLLNTEAQRGKMTNEQIAWWSGRANQAQNEVYNNMTEQERVDRAKEILTDSTGDFSIVPFRPNGTESIKATVPGSNSRSSEITTHGYWRINTGNKPASCQDLDMQPQLSGINTLYGRCEHDYVLSPCEGFAQCLDCSDHTCIKGSGGEEQEKLVRIKELMSLVAHEVNQAKAKMDDGDWGAQDWYNAQSKWHDKLQQLVDILQSNQTQEGALVKLAGSNSQTHLHRVLRSVAMRALENNTVPSDVVQEMLVAIKQDDMTEKSITIYRPPPLSHSLQSGAPKQEKTHGA
ncbi:hypothetical protein [Rhodoferax sp.]|uniref:hypothetical protein n=1 Tax=Rhodoferax sp. TaxID=50421 RepID=UPI00284D10EA|nr:hypothetical protein [Rhodoferax sp.]MDR3368689.1 hypothetical protein [Rhodoferax sp.]